MNARVFNIQKYSIYDGPGIRTLVFFQGCPLRCLWCSNPEGKEARSRVLWSGALCVRCGQCVPACPRGLHGLEGSPPRHVFETDGCAGCGACVRACAQRALSVSGRLMAISEIMAVVMEDEAFYRTSGGGLTLGGGEPLAQPQAACSLLAAARASGLHTAMETCGYARQEDVAAAAPLTDLFLYDVKHMDTAAHKMLTGRDNGLILKNLAWLLENGFRVRVRMPLINGCNADMGEMAARSAFLARWQGRPNFLGVDLLPYHRLGVHKYAQLGEAYSLDGGAELPADFLDRARALFSGAGIQTAVVRH